MTEYEAVQRITSLRRRGWWMQTLVSIVITGALGLLYEYHEIWWPRILLPGLCVAAVIAAQHYVHWLIAAASEVGDAMGSQRMQESCEIAYNRGRAAGYSWKNPNDRPALLREARAEVLKELDLASTDTEILISQLQGTPEGIRWTKDTMMLKGAEAAKASCSCRGTASTSAPRGSG